MPPKKYISPEITKNTIEELSKQLLKANAELSKLQEEREIMFSNISHDLRAPMTAIRSAIDLALSENKPSLEELISTIELIDRRSKTLESLVNDMYYLYSVNNVPKSLEFEKIDAIPFLEEYFFDLKADSRYDSFITILDIDQEIDCIINIDVQKIVRVLDNLFSNAIKHSRNENNRIKAEKPIIKMRVRHYGDKLSISVVDNGPGILEKDLPYIFMRMYTVSNARTPENGKDGSGLGLAIAKAIIEKHNGTIECHSIPNIETVFTITLPCTLST